MSFLQSKTLFRQLALVLASTFAWVSPLEAATITASTCSLPDVSAAVASATVGDTVRVPAGTCAWSGRLNIGKNISLIGAGIGNSIINGADGLIGYQPSDPSANALFRVSGFTFDFQGSAAGFELTSGPTLIIQTKLRVDHNRFQNAGAQYIHYRGFRGVIDNNLFGPVRYPLRTEFESFGNGGKTEWNNFEGIELGRPDGSVYFEDNTFEDIQDILVDCQVGNRYSFRYNTFHLSVGTYPLMDMHGNQGSGFYSCFGGEIYGNNVTGGQNGTFLDQRGGRVFVFNNNVTAAMGFQIREEYDDAISPVSYVGPNAPQLPQHVNGSYYWGNRINLTGGLLEPYINDSCSTCQKNGLAAGVDFFFDGSSPGVGCGPLTNRPATCAPGQAWWATSQSCTNLTGMVGAHPATPIAGTLYRCASTGRWASGVSPLPYPHPLRAEAGGALAAPRNLRIGP
jgi:hypothetical protein